MEIMVPKYIKKRDTIKLSKSNINIFNRECSENVDFQEENDRKSAISLERLNVNLVSLNMFQGGSLPIRKHMRILLKGHEDNSNFCDARKKADGITILSEFSDSKQNVKIKKSRNANSSDNKILLITKVVNVIVKKYAAIVSYGLNLLSDPSNMFYEDDRKSRKVPNEAGKGTKRKRGNAGEGGSKSIKSTKQEKETAKKSKSSSDKVPDVTALDFGNDSKSAGDSPWNFKISSWNINGIRAWLKKDGMSYLHHEQPDVLCVQETKCSDDKLPEEMREVEGYHTYWLSADKEGYSGVGLLSKEKPTKVEYGIGIPEHDNEGRVITAEYDLFYLVASYVPNAGRGLVRLEYRMKWDEDFRAYLKKLDEKKPVILCGDLNVAHKEIDLANPKTNTKNAGFTKEEREGFSNLLGEGFMDTFRHLYPDLRGAYTFWTYMMNARAKNVGWRLDYFVISERFSENLCDSVIRKDVLGSDHCPITLFLSL